jgi:hypothetical protein
MAAALLVSACATGSDTIPEGLVGRWTTTASSHADRFFEVGPATLRISQGEAGVASYPITGVRVADEGGRTLVELQYVADAESEAFFRLLYDPAKGEARLKNREAVVWTRGD